MRIALLLIIFFAVTSGRVSAQNIDSSAHPQLSLLDTLSKSHILWHDIKEGAYDGVSYFEQPLHWDAKDWLLVAAVGGVTYLSEATVDNNVRKLFQRNQSNVGNSISQFGDNFYGNGYATALSALSLYSIGLFSDDSKIRLMGRDVVESFAYAGITTTLLKVIFGRERPYNNNGPNVYHGFTLNDAWNSLPSGHVTVAAALSSTLAAEIDNPYATAGLYSLVGLTMYSRMYTDKHWLSDTFLGGVIGSVTGYWVVNQTEHYDLSTNDAKPTSFVIEPGLGNLTLAYRF